MTKIATAACVLALSAIAAAPAKADTLIGTFTTGSQLDDGGCATTTFSRGIGTGFTSANVQISGWDLRYTDSDHHITRARAEISNVVYNSATGNVSFTANTCFHDVNLDDDYRWQISFTIVAQR
jgi:hypothetical protein